MDSWLALLALTVAAFFTSTISAVIGMAGGVTLLSIMTFFLPWSSLVPVHGIVQLVSNSSRAYFLKQHVKRPILLAFIIGAPLGAALAVSLVKQLEDPRLPLILIAALILYTLFKPKKLPALKLPNWAFVIVGLASGFLGILVGATGPFLAPFFLRKDWVKEEIVATKAATQMITHILKIPSFLFLGFDYLEHWLLLTLLPIAAIAGTGWGVKILSGVSEKWFRWLYQAALLVAATRILYKVFTA